MSYSFPFENIHKSNNFSKFLSKKAIPAPLCNFCCCQEEPQPTYKFQDYPYFLPTHKISVNKLIKKRSVANIHHASHVNNNFSISENSKKIKNNHEESSQIRNYDIPQHIDRLNFQNSIGNHHQNIKLINPSNRIFFNYSQSGFDQGTNKNLQKVVNQTQKTYPRPQLVKQQIQNSTKGKIMHQKITQVEQNDISIQDQINKILNVNEQPQQTPNNFESQKYPNPKQKSQLKIEQKIPKPKNQMINFSFGQNQKSAFMQKYMNSLNVTQRKLIEFNKGTFNKQNRINFNNTVKYIIKSSSQFSELSRQSEVIESYQSRIRNHLQPAKNNN